MHADDRRIRCPRSREQGAVGVRFYARRRVGGGVEGKRLAWWSRGGGGVGGLIISLLSNAAATYLSVCRGEHNIPCYYFLLHS